MTRPPFGVLAAFILAGCATTPNSDAASRSSALEIPVDVEGIESGRIEGLLAAARLELDSFQYAGRRAAALDDAAHAMRRNLRDDGYAHAKVEFRMEPTEADVSRVVFEIEDGPRAVLAGIEFTGVVAFDETRLRRFFKPTPLTDDASDGATDVFRRSEVDAGVAKVESLYLAAGYCRVKAGPAVVSWDDALTRARVAVPIEEGRSYTVREVRFELESATFPTSRLEQEMRPFVGRPYSVHVLSDAAATTRILLGEEGRLQARIIPKAEIDDDAGTATLLLRVSPGPRLRIGGVRVVGNERTDSSFIEDESQLEAGALLTQRRLDHAIESLYGAGLFKSVRVDRTPIETEGDVHETEIAIRVEEVEARTVDLEVGYGSYELLRAAARYRDRNFLGRGRVFELASTASLKSYGGELKFFDSYVFGRSNTLESTTGFLFREEPSFDSESITSELAVRHRFDRTTSLRGGYRFRLSDASNVSDAPTTGPLPDSAVISGPFGELDYDGRNDVFNPTKGVRATAGVALSASALGADLDFLEAKAAFSAYLPLGEFTTLAVGLRAADRRILRDGQALPIQERFFLGGGDSVRSFGESELGPTGVSGRPIGGQFSLDGSIELRRRLFGDLYGAVFYDVGTVSLDSLDASGPYGHAFGAGLRYLLPFGPVRLDFALNPGRRFAADDDWAVHFSFGFSF